jgi:hypothetical protein
MFTKAKITESFTKLVRSNLIKVMEDNIPKVQEVILNSYDENLIGKVTNRRSKTNPSLYLEEFTERLEEFEYIDDSQETVVFVVPDIENFDFSGRLRVVHTILEGTVGKYMEVSAEQWGLMSTDPIINQDPFDEFVPKKDRIYIMRATNRLLNSANDLPNNLKLVEYPFSNTPPIDIFEDADRYVEAEMDEWMDKALDEAKKELFDRYTGVM